MLWAAALCAVSIVPSAAGSFAQAAPHERVVSVSTASAGARAAFLRGRDLMDAQRWSEARAQFREALRLDPSFATALAFLGHTTTGAQGSGLLNRASALSSGLPEAERLTIQELLAEKRGESEQALYLLEKVAAVASEDWYAQFRLGARLQLDNRLDAAVRVLERSVALNPDAAPSYNALGYALAWQGKFEEAIAAMKKTAALLPAEPNPMDSLGEVLLMSDRLPEAEAAFLSSTRLAPGFWIGWTGVAQVRAMLGRYEDSRDALLRARGVAADENNRLICDVFKAWVDLLEGRTASALQVLDAVEKEASRQREPALHAQAALERGRILLESGLVDAALLQIELGLGRVEQEAMLGADRTDQRRRGLSTLVDAQVRKGQTSALAATVRRAEELARASPFDVALRSVVHFARGGRAVASGDLVEARLELEQCQVEDAFCRRLLLRALEQSGDRAGAKALHAKIVAMPRRDPVYAGGDPMNLYVRAQLLRPASNKL